MVNCITVIKQNKSKVFCRVSYVDKNGDHKMVYIVKPKEYKSTIANINLGKIKIKLSDLDAKVYTNIMLATEEFVREE